MITRATQSESNFFVELRTAENLFYMIVFFFLLSFRYGIQNEPLAKESLEIKLGVNILSCGLFVDKKLTFLAASPDGLIDKIIQS